MKPYKLMGRVLREAGRPVGRSHLLQFWMSLLLIFLHVSGCSPRVSDIEEVDYVPLTLADWEVSTPAEQGLDPRLVSELYRNAEELPNLYSLLIVKNGYLVAERYFNGRTVDSKSALASVTKSYTSALLGIALDKGYLSGLDQKMMDLFPEFAGQYSDPRKDQITIGDMLKMRSGYPWEEFTPPYLDTLVTSNDWLPFIVQFPLVSDPGSTFGYSNLTAHVLGIIVARASGKGLMSFGQENLFWPLDIQVGAWPYDKQGYYYGSGDISFTARDVAKFGFLYLNDGLFEGSQIVSAKWVNDSLQSYSQGIYDNKLGRYFREIGYGYMWWSAAAGDHRFSYAWGHGGNLIILLQDLEMVIVTTADPLHGQFGEAAWQKERAVIDLVGKFIQSIPGD